MSCEPSVIPPAAATAVAASRSIPSSNPNLGKGRFFARFVRGLNGFDLFFALNVVLFVLMCAVRHYARWTAYAGSGTVATAEFFFYATVLMAAATALWLWLRRYPVPGWLLVLIEFGILIQFAGGLLNFGSARLYDHVFFTIRFDKYVHFANAFIASVAVTEILRLKGMSVGGLVRFLILFVVLGLGSMIEISEYIVTLTIPGNGVGGYDDNMRDLIANCCGGVSFLFLSAVASKIKGGDR